MSGAYPCLRGSTCLLSFLSRRRISALWQTQKSNSVAVHEIY